MCAKVKKTLRCRGTSPAACITPAPAMANADSPASPDIIRYGVGLDVHKYKIAVCIAAQLATGEMVQLKDHLFLATPTGLDEMCRFLAKYRPVAHYLMECTGVYHLPVFHALQKAFPDSATQVIAMNPLLLNRRLTDLGTKNDKVSAAGLANLSFHDSLLRPSYIGTMEFYRTRELMRSHTKARHQCTKFANRILQCLASVNLKYPFDLGAEWQLELLDWYLHKAWPLGEALDALICHKRDTGAPAGVLEKHRPEFLEYGSFSLSTTTRFVLQMELGRHLYEDTVACAYLRQAEQLVVQLPELQEKYLQLTSIPGLGSVSALTVLLELGDYRRFAKWKALAKYCGVVPLTVESGEAKAKGHINRYSNANLRVVLTQAASVLIGRQGHETDLGQYAYQQRHLRQLPFKKAMMKVAQKLTRVIYAVLVLNIEYNPTHETGLRMKIKRERQLQTQKSLLESYRTRALRRDIQSFFVSKYEFLNSTSRYHLVAGFERMIRKARYRDRQPPE